MTYFCTFCILLDWCRCVEGVWQANPPSIKPKIYLEARSNASEGSGAEYQEKLLRLMLLYPYRKPTQVDEASSLRWTGEPSLRNSAKKLDVSSRDVSPAARLAAVKFSQATVYQKHRSLQTRKGKYRGWHLTSAGTLRGAVQAVPWSASERRR